MHAVTNDFSFLLQILALVKLFVYTVPTSVPITIDLETLNFILLKINN